MKQPDTLLIVLAATALSHVACSNEKDLETIGEVPGEETEEPIEEEPEQNNGDPENGMDGKAGTVELFHGDKTYDGYVLVNDPGNNSVYLMDKEATIVYAWELPNPMGNDVQLLPNGALLGSFIAEDPKIIFGGKAGKIQYFNIDGSLEWTFDHSTEEYISHHDVELLPNGNIITLVWEKRTVEQAKEAGSKLDIPIFPEAIIEYDPVAEEIVWEWHSWDHLVQDHDAEKEHYGVLRENPHLIDLNHVLDRGGDIMHANEISHDPVNDLIFVSVNFYSEVWVIDHSTTTQEAASHSGGNFGRGGDLVHRIGNPSAYGDFDSQRLFVNNHFPNLFENGKMLIFSNGGDLNRSTVYELKLPEELQSQEIPELNTPEVLWSFTDSQLYSSKVSGAVRLPNGNTLITEGDFGLWEVTSQG